MLNSLLGRRNRKRLKYLALAYVLGLVPANYTTTAMSHDLSIGDASAVVDQVKENGLVSNLTGGLNQLLSLIHI